MVIKKCVVCGKEFDTKGRTKTCSEECCKEDRKRYNKQYYQDNKEKMLEYHKQYRENNKEKRLEYSKRHYQDNREKRLESQKQYNKNNKEKILEYNKKYYQDNKDRLNAKRAKRIIEEINELKEQYDGDLEKILENIPSKWHLREAQMQVWFNESYYDGIIAKMKSTPCCEVTGEKDNLVIHHLWSFDTYPKLSNDPANMVRITEEVHKAFHKEYGYGNNTPEQWEEFVSNYVKR